MTIGEFGVDDPAGKDAKTCEEYKKFTNGNGELMKNCNNSPECIVYVDNGESPFSPMKINDDNIFKHLVVKKLKNR